MDPRQELEIRRQIKQAQTSSDPRAELEARRRLSDSVMSDSFDRKTGAPASVRASVGPSYRNTVDRLNTLRKTYPDAQIYGPDNFVYTDPETGQATLYNPEGMDVGDLAEYGRVIPEMAGGVAGAFAGAPAGPGGSAMGAGLGAGIGGQAYDAGMELFGGRVDTRSIPQRLVDAETDVIVNAAGQRVGDLIPGVISQGVAGVKNRTAGVMGPAMNQLYKKYSIPLEGALPGLSGSRATQGAVDSLSKLPTSSGLMREQVGKTVDAVTELGKGIRSGFGEATTPEEGGRAIQQGLATFTEQFQNKASSLYSGLDKFVGADDVVPMTNTFEALKGKLDTFAGLEYIGREAVPSKFRGFLTDLANNDGQMTWGQMKAFRTLVGEKISNPAIVTADDVSKQQWRSLYGALSQDMEQYAVEKGGGQAFKRANNYWRGGAKRIEQLEKLIKAKKTEDAFRLAFNGAHNGGTAIRALRKSMPDDMWGDVLSAKLYQMGLPQAGVQGVDDTFSIATFATNWGDRKLSQSAKNAMFSGKRFKGLAEALDDFVVMAKGWKDQGAIINSSNTAMANVYNSLFTGSAMVGGYNAGGPEGAIVGGGLALLSPYVAARLLTSPKVVKWLTEGGRSVMKGNTPTGHLMRLGGIAEVEPALKEEIQQLFSMFVDSQQIPTQQQTQP